MHSVPEVMTALERKGSESVRRIFGRHGIDLPTFGVKVGDLKTIAKTIKGNHELALELFATGHYDAMYLAGLVADGGRMTKAQIDAWARQAKCEALSTYVIPWIACESKHAHELALKWMKSKDPGVAVSGWATYSGLVAVAPDDELDLDEISRLLARVVKEIHRAPNKVRYAMNNFVIAVGACVGPLVKAATAAAKSIGKVDVDMGETSCKVPLASAAIEKIRAMGRTGKKRKSIRC